MNKQDERKAAEEAQKRANNLAPRIEGGESFTDFVYRTFEQWHAGAMTRARTHYIAVAVDKALGTLDRGVVALERIADALSKPADAPKG